MTRIAVNHNFGPNMVLAGMRDGAAVNGTAIKQLLFFCPNIIDGICFCVQSLGHIFLPLGKSVSPQL